MKGGWNDMLGVLGIHAMDKGIEKNANEILFDNFIVQAKKQSILTLKSGCQKPFMWGPVYIALYDCLVEVKIIDKRMTKSAFFTWESTYTVTKTISLEPNHIQQLLEKRASKDSFRQTRSRSRSRSQSRSRTKQISTRSRRHHHHTLRHRRHRS
jgi:hypothetical protein